MVVFCVIVDFIDFIWLFKCNIFELSIVRDLLIFIIVLEEFWLLECFFKDFIFIELFVLLLLKGVFMVILDKILLIGGK